MRVSSHQVFLHLVRASEFCRARVRVNSAVYHLSFSNGSFQRHVAFMQVLHHRRHPWDFAFLSISGQGFA